MPGAESLVNGRVLICTDLDGTLIPDGRGPEPAAARRLFGRVTTRPEVTLAYVTGRHRTLVEEAIDELSLPAPDFVVADVGTTVYEVERGRWRSSESWRERLAAEWAGDVAPRVAAALRALPGLRLQQQSRQAEFKVSFCVDGAVDVDELLRKVEGRLATEAARARLIFSRDSRGTGLLDVVPPGSGKLAAVEFLIEALGLQPERVVFSGDSGNDLEVLASRLPAVLVANADAEVEKQARRLAAANGSTECLYVACGGLLGMNGNYASGILEGLVHFLPETREWLS